MKRTILKVLVIAMALVLILPSSAFAAKAKFTERDTEQTETVTRPDSQTAPVSRPASQGTVTRPGRLISPGPGEAVPEKMVISTVQIDVGTVAAGGSVNGPVLDGVGYKIAHAQWMPPHPVFEAGQQYTIQIWLEPEEGYEFSADCTAVVNYNAAEIELSEDGAYVEYTFDLPPVQSPKLDQKWAVEFSVDVPVPVSGDKPGEATALSEGYEIWKTEWSPKDAVFKPDTEYTVKVFFYVDEDYALRSDYFGLVNGEQADMPIDYEPEDFYLTYTFPKTAKTEESGEPLWSKASSWALDELGKAQALDLIPAGFKGYDLTKPVTRLEFAKIAYKMFEEINGPLRVERDNPFRDTDDPDVLLAYAAGITNGTKVYDDETMDFSPNEKITREQMATMLTRALNSAGTDTSAKRFDFDMKPFADDALLHDWGKNAVYYMAGLGSIKGVGDNKFDPLGSATREQAIIVSYRSVKAVFGQF